MLYATFAEDVGVLWWPYLRLVLFCQLHHLDTMQSVLSIMGTPAPQHVVDALCQRLREIEHVEKESGGEDLANECRTFIYQQGEVKWMDVMMTAYLINGGVILRDAMGKMPKGKCPRDEQSTPTAASAAATPVASAIPVVASAMPASEMEKPATAASTVLIKSPNAANSPDFTDEDLKEIENMVSSLGIGVGASL